MMRIPLLLCVCAGLAFAQDWQASEAAAAKASRAAKYGEAETILLQNQAVAEKFGEQDARLARTVFDLGEVFRAEGKYGESLGEYQRAARLYIGISGQQSPELARVMEGEGEVYRNLNDYPDAEPLLQQALAMRQSLKEPSAAEIAQSQSDLAEVYTLEGKLAQAKPLLETALATRKSLGPEDEATGDTLAVYGMFYRKSGQFADAEASYRQAMSIYGKTVGGDHPNYANAAEALAMTLIKTGDYSTAEALLQRVLQIRTQVFGAEHRDIATSYGDFAMLLRAEHKSLEAAGYLEKSIAIEEKVLGADSSDVAADLSNLGALYETIPEKRDLAEKCLHRALAIDEKSAGSDSVEVSTDVQNLGIYYELTKGHADAVQAYERAFRIRAKLFGDRNRLTLQSMGSYASALRAANRLPEALAIEARMKAALSAGAGR